jgi:hypothetical protein
LLTNQVHTVINTHRQVPFHRVLHPLCFWTSVMKPSGAKLRRTGENIRQTCACVCELSVGLFEHVLISLTTFFLLPNSVIMLCNTSLLTGPQASLKSADS